MHQYVRPHHPCFLRVYRLVEEIKELNNRNTRHHTEWTTRLQEFGERSALVSRGGPTALRSNASLSEGVRMPCAFWRLLTHPASSSAPCNRFSSQLGTGFSTVPPGLCTCHSNHLAHADLPGLTPQPPSDWSKSPSLFPHAPGYSTILLAEEMP